MGNKPSARPDATVHASLARSQSRRVNISSRSFRRTSLLSVRRRESVTREPPEKLPPNVVTAFEVDPVELKMQRNLCGCVHPIGRVDIVFHGPRPLVDRRIGFHADPSDVRPVRQELSIHCYLTRQRMLATPDQQPHRHLVELRGFFESMQTLHVLTEYYPHGSLLAVLGPETRSSSKCSVLQSDIGIQRAVRELCSAVSFMHEEAVAHMDISLENVFVDAAGSLRLGDFRHAVYIGKIQRRRCIAPAPLRKVYAAPELYSGREIDLLKADAWSVGIVIAMMLTKQTLMEEATTRDTHYRLLQVLGVPAFLERMLKDSGAPMGTHVTPVVGEIVQLVTGLLVCEPDERLSLRDSLEKFPWLKDPPAEVATLSLPSTSAEDPTDLSM